MSWIPAAITTAFGIYTLTDWDFMTLALTHSSYYIVLFSCVVWLVLTYLFFSSRRSALKEFFWKYYPGILSALVLTVSVFLSVKAEYKVLADETNLLCVSKGMLLDKTVQCAHMGKAYYDLFFPVDYILDKRPYLFPFLGSVLHTFLGYRPENFFILNALTLFGLLSLTYVVFRRILAPPVAFAAQLLILSQPIITISATSAGLELFTALYFFLCMVLVYFFMRAPEDKKLPYLWINLILFSHCRYESPIFAVMIIIGLFALRSIKLSMLWPARWLYTLTPLFYLPIVWQRLLKFEDHENPPDTKPFALSNLWEHVQDFVIGQVGTGFQYPYASLVNVVGWVFTIALLYSFFSRKFRFKANFQNGFTLLFIVCVVTNLTLFLSYHFANYAHPAASRYFIIVTLVVSLAPLLYHRLYQAIPSYAFFLYGLVAFLIYHPVAIDSQPTHALHKARELSFVYDFLDKFPEKHFLVIADRPSFYTVKNYGSVSLGWANKYPEKIFHEWYRHLYREVLVIQKILYETGKPLRGYELHPDFKLEMLTELQNNENEYLRISRAVKK
jgi:hypothetical protein